MAERLASQVNRVAAVETHGRAIPAERLVRRVKHLDRERDIPDFAGYSLDGHTIYIDRHMPQSFKFRGRVIETDRFLLLHEEVEKTLIDRLGLHYLHAHQIATRAEQAAVRAAGISWRAISALSAHIAMFQSMVL